MVFDLDQSFELDAWDPDTGDDLGTTHVTVRQLLLSKDRRMELLLFDKESMSPIGTKIKVKCDLIPLLFVRNAKIPKGLPKNELVKLSFQIYPS